MIYNPFKPHIVEHSDGYTVRRFFIFSGWECFDRDATMWWCAHEYHRKYCWLRTLDEAKKLLAKANKGKVIYQ